ncbi:MAG: sugar ABC transporter permease [Anaerolineaceae bacterium]|nr:sugar ABC transporter permease [Anaerolineaceae bacterium]
MTEDLKVTSHRKMGGLKWLMIKEQITGYLFVLPALLIVFVFGLFPIGYSVYMSLFNWGVTKGDFVGSQNYLEIFGNWTNLLIILAGVILIVAAYWIWNKAFRSLSKGEMIARIIGAILLLAGGVIFISGWAQMNETGDPKFLQSLIVTLYYALGTVPAEIVIGMVLAFILYQDIKGKDTFRMIFFLPYVTPAVSTAVVFQIIFSNRPTNIANTVIGLFGVDPLKWRFESKPVTTLLGMNLEGFWSGPSLALVTIILFGVWTFIGYNTVIFLAGLGNVPKELYEAAEIDGAKKVDMFRYITMPLLSPVTFYLTLVAFIGTFKAFNHLYVMRTPSARYSVITTSILIWDRFYKANQYSIATTQAIVLFLVILGLTFAQNKILGEKVFYG